MLAIVNEDLMSFEPTFVDDQINHRNYFKLRVLTSTKLLQRQSDLGRKDPRSRKDTSRRGDYCLVDRSDRIIPVNREVLRISAPFKEISNTLLTKEKFKSYPLNWNQYPMSVNVTSTSRFTNQVEIRCHHTGEDRANIFVVAFPFNGMIRPLKEDPRYRIYKGFISSSIKPFFHNNHKYRKVLYLVIEINKNLFRPDHYFHTDKIDIEFESFALFTDRDTDEKKTNREKMILNITSPNGDFNLDWEYETINDSILMNIPNMDLWPTFDFNKARQDGEMVNHRPNSRRNGKKKYTPRPMVVEGNTMVTTNKHGIRKEIPIGKGKPNHRDYQDSYYDRDSYPQKNGTRNNQNRNRRSHGNGPSRSF